jgi:hypothetical protein
MSNDELEGRVRAIEAILLEIPEVTPDVIKPRRHASEPQTPAKAGRGCLK